MAAHLVFPRNPEGAVESAVVVGAWADEEKAAPAVPDDRMAGRRPTARRLHARLGDDDGVDEVDELKDEDACAPLRAVAGALCTRDTRPSVELVRRQLQALVYLLHHDAVGVLVAHEARQVEGAEGLPRAGSTR